MNSWTYGTSKQYSPHLKRWFQFCTDKNLDPLNTNASERAEFLTKYFNTLKCKFRQ